MPTTRSTPGSTPAGARALDASLDRAAIAEATHRRRTIDLLTEVLETEARVAALTDHADVLRSELLGRARDYRDEQGMAPTWRASVGQVIYSEAKAKVGIVDREGFATWAATSHPEAVTATLRLDMEELGPVLAACRDAGLVPLAVDFGVDSTWERGFLKGVVVEGETAFAPGTGEDVPGVALLPPGKDTISVRPDAEVKARLIAEVRASTLAHLSELEAVDEAPAEGPSEVAEVAEVADAIDAATHPEDLVVDPAEGVVRTTAPAEVDEREQWLQAHEQAALAADPNLSRVVARDDAIRALLRMQAVVAEDHPRSRPIEDVALPEAPVEGHVEDAGPAPDYDDEPADADAGPRWHAQQWAADPRLAFSLNALSGARLREVAAELGLDPFDAGTKRPAMANTIRGRIQLLLESEGGA